MGPYGAPESGRWGHGFGPRAPGMGWGIRWGCQGIRGDGPQRPSAAPVRSSADDWDGGSLRRFPDPGYPQRPGITKDFGCLASVGRQVPSSRSTSDMLVFACPSTAMADSWMIWFRVSSAVSVA